MQRRPSDFRQVPVSERRALLRTFGAAGAGTLLLANPALRAFAADAAEPGGSTIELPFANGRRQLVAFPQKRPLILLTNRPPQLETPFSVFNDGLLTPNDAFFVRYHWSGIPTEVDPAKFRLKVSGRVDSALELSLDELKKMRGATEIVAVAQCSGNSRGFFEPRVNGGQLANGAMGNARWHGVPLKAVLDKAGVQAGAVQVTFNGLDHPPVGDGPDFIKSLDIDHARDGEVMLAWGMNGADLPMLNGYPLRLVVPGYYGTYWIKHVSDIEVIDKTFDGFWVKAAYRIPDNDCACVAPGTTPKATVPINRFNVRSFLTSHTDGARVPVGQSTLLRGIAFDGGRGITGVAVSFDGGRNWTEAKLGEDMGRYSFREWSVRFSPSGAGEHAVKVRAFNRIGESQPMTALWNPPGYMRNVVETTRLVAA